MAGLLSPAYLAIEHTEVEMAVGYEWTHAEFVGQGQGLVVMGCGSLTLQGLIAPRRNVAEEAQCIRLVAAFLVLPGECQRTLSQGLRLLQAAGLQMRLPQGKTTEPLIDDSFRGNGLLHGLREQRYSVSDTAT